MAVKWPVGRCGHRGLGVWGLLLWSLDRRGCSSHEQVLPDRRVKGLVGCGRSVAGGEVWPQGSEGVGNLLWSREETVPRV